MLINVPEWGLDGHACNPRTKKRYQKEQKRQKKLIEEANGQ